MALRDAGGQGDRDPGLDAVHSHPLQVGDNCDAIKRTSRGLDRVDDRIYCRTKPRLQLETDPYSRANYKTQFSVNQHLTVKYRDPISKDFTLHLEYNREV